MYFNNVHILFYVLVAFIGLYVGKIVAWSIYRFINGEKIFNHDFFNMRKFQIEKIYLCMISTAIIYIYLLYKFGIDLLDLEKNLELLKYIILIPMLIVAFFVDLKKRIIPNRLNLTIFETGLIISFVYGINNVNIAKDYILGMIIGSLIFIFITILGYIVFGKEAMGLGDVKYIGALGLYYGLSGIIEISLFSFVIAAVISILAIIIRLILRKKDDYIAFGPFISVAALVIIFLPTGFVLDNFMFICKLLGDKILFL